MALNIRGGDKLNSLASKIKKGDKRAAASLYDELADRVFGFCLSRVGKREVAEDLTQDIFFKLLNKIDAFDEKKGNFAVWFWRLARNRVVDYYREKKPLPFSAFAYEEVEKMAYAEPVLSLDVKLAYEDLEDFIASLDNHERQLFELRYLAELSYRDIAQILERSEVSLRVTMSRLKGKVREYFKD